MYLQLKDRETSAFVSAGNCSQVCSSKHVSLQICAMSESPDEIWFKVTNYRSGEEKKNKMSEWGGEGTTRNCEQNNITEKNSVDV